tara:strand:- start:307 stop:561 length:255 start_codon:yes stop_codon:yes gene_type:complete
MVMVPEEVMGELLKVIPEVPPTIPIEETVPPVADSTLALLHWLPSQRRTCPVAGDRMVTVPRAPKPADVPVNELGAGILHLLIS